MTLETLRMQVYQTHTQRGSFDMVMRGIQRSELSERTKERLPNCNQALTTLRNANFLLDYWRCEDGALDSIHGGYGFRLGDGARVEWDD